MTQLGMPRRAEASRGRWLVRAGLPTQAPSPSLAIMIVHTMQGPTSGVPAGMHMPPRRTQKNKRTDKKGTLTVFVPGRRHCPNKKERLGFRGRAAVSV